MGERLGGGVAVVATDGREARGIAGATPEVICGVGERLDWEFGRGGTGGGGRESCRIASGRVMTGGSGPCDGKEFTLALPLLPAALGE
jgi:hypothetical protein